jgi:hypothetical protein
VLNLFLKKGVVRIAKDAKADLSERIRLSFSGLDVFIKDIGNDTWLMGKFANGSTIRLCRWDRILSDEERATMKEEAARCFSR